MRFSCCNLRHTLTCFTFRTLVLLTVSPNLDAHLERFFGSLKSECLDYLILFGEKAMRLAEYPDRRGPLSLALVAEAAFDPLADVETRRYRIDRTLTVTIPDYPSNRPMTSTDFAEGATGSKPLPIVQNPAFHPTESKLFRYQYGVREAMFTLVQSCVDFDNDGQRELVYGSRTHQMCHLLCASNGSVRWSRSLPGACQSISAHI